MPRPLKVGVQLPEVEYLARWSDLRVMARTAEEVGLDSIWVGDHLLYRQNGNAVGPWEAWTTLAAIAAITERVELGPLVASTSFHNPGMIAKKAATLEEISGGRLILGLGAGWNETEYRAFGFAYDRRVSRFEEAFTVIRTLLRNGEIDFHGEFYELDQSVLHPRGPRPEGPPLMIGSIGERMLSITLPHVNAWNAWYNWFGNTPEGYRPMRDKVDAACRAAGRDPGEVERTVALFVQLPEGKGRVAGALGRSDETPPIRSDPDELAGALTAFANEGVRHVQLVLDPITAHSIAALRPALELMDR